jgi:hypothetical protein
MTGGESGNNHVEGEGNAQRSHTPHHTRGTASWHHPHYTLSTTPHHTTSCHTTSCHIMPRHPQAVYVAGRSTHRFPGMVDAENEELDFGLGEEPLDEPRDQGELEPGGGRRGSGAESRGGGAGESGMGESGIGTRGRIWRAGVWNHGGEGQPREVWREGDAVGEAELRMNGIRYQNGSVHGRSATACDTPAVLCAHHRPLVHRLLLL